MRRRRLLWQIFPAYLAITLAALTAVTWYVSRSLEQFHVSQTAADLEARARLLEPQLAGLLEPVRRDAVDALSKRLGPRAATRITVILLSGEVLGDSLEDPRRMDNHADRPEVMAALAGRVGSTTRFSHTLGKRMMYVAVPVVGERGVVGVVRTSVPMTAIDLALQGIYQQIGFAGLAVALLTALLSLLVARRISRPLEAMKQGAQRFADGELERRLPVSGSEEIAGLAEALNRMAAQLDERLRTVVRQRNEQEAVLASMVEGVLAVDTEERVIRINRAAAQLLDADLDRAQGRRIREVVRKADLLRFVARTLAGGAPAEEDIVLRGEGRELFLQAHGTVLWDAAHREIGALIVLHDVTRLRRLESIRRDFVANVSHELKTPITAIKAAAETLRDGAIRDPEGGVRFVEIVAKQADRLGAIIDDLLALSRIEQGVEEHGIALERGPVRPVLEAAIQTCAISAHDKKVSISLYCSPELEARRNPPLLEQAVVNLLTNAIKYSRREGKVVVDAGQHREKVMIKVQDWGCGIPPEHLPRIFERFYRVDKARSRAQGGTGLGLAIVKHIAQAHGGEVVVHSTPGEGSVFTIILPAV